jgi:hypothetical protein
MMCVHVCGGGGTMTNLRQRVLDNFGDRLDPDTSGGTERAPAAAKQFF